MQSSRAAGGDTQTFAAVLGGSRRLRDRRRHHGADVARGRRARRRGRHGGPAGALFRRVEEPGADHRSQAVQGPDDRHLARARTPTTASPSGCCETTASSSARTPRSSQVNPGTEIGAMLAGQADMAIAYQPSVAAAEAQGAKVVFDFSNYVGPVLQHRHHGPALDDPRRIPRWSQALVTSFEEASRSTYADPAYRQEGRAPGVPRSSRRGRRQGDRCRAEVSDPGRRPWSPRRTSGRT